MTLGATTYVFSGGGGGGARAGSDANGLGGGANANYPTGVGGAGAKATSAALDGRPNSGSGGGGGSVAHPTGGRGAAGTVMVYYNVFALTYNANGYAGTVPPQVIHLASGELTPVADQGTLAKTGYKFSGWNTTSTGSGTTHMPGAEIGISANTTLYARFAANSYDVAFDANGADGGSMVNQSFVYDTAQNLTTNAWTRTGYTFAGWNTEADGSGTAYADQQSVSNLTSVDGDTVQLYAQWIPNDYTVAYVANGGGGPPMANQDFVYDVAEALNPNTFTRTGYLFDGWRADDPAGTLYADRQQVSNLTALDGAVVTMSALWEPINFYVRFDTNGGTGSMPVQPFSFDDPQDLTANTLTRTGHTFTGWNTEADGTGTAYADHENVSNLTDVDQATVVLYAQWAANHYTVAFGGNGGARAMPGQSFTYGSPQALAANTFTRSGFDFAGWNTAADGSGTAYADRQVVSNLTPIDGATVTLYAQWEKADTSGVPNLPNTGGPSRWLLLAVLLLLVGGTVVFASRRRL